MTEPIDPESPLSTGQAAELYGFGSGSDARRRFVRHVEERERLSGKPIFLRQGDKRRITANIVRRRLPELTKAKLTAIEQRIKSGMRKIDDNLDSRIDERIAKHPTICTLQEQHEQVTEILAEVVDKLERATR